MTFCQNVLKYFHETKLRENLNLVKYVNTLLLYVKALKSYSEKLIEN